MSSRSESAAQLLLGARRGKTLLSGLPSECDPRSRREAYDIQDDITRALGVAIAGWKVGSFGTGEVFSAPLYEDTLSRRTSIVASELNKPLVEVEIAFILRRSIPRRAPPPAEFEQWLSFVPLFEVISSRYADIFSVSSFALLADNNASGMIIPGTPIEAWVRRAEAPFTIRIEVNGQLTEVPCDRTTLSKAVRMVAAVVEGADGRTGPLLEGTLITTGAMVTPVPAAGRITADFGPLGSISLDTIP
jgi:2-keto-4-pentenoate hydratase